MQKFLTKENLIAVTALIAAVSGALLVFLEAV